MKSRTSAVFSKSDKSVGQWINILNFYKNHHDDLSEEEVVEIYDESEKCRDNFNSKHSNRFNRFGEEEVSTDLYPRAKKILNDKFKGAVTTSHHVAR